jgi:hypothetical protein
VDRFDAAIARVLLKMVRRSIERHAGPESADGGGLDARGTKKVDALGCETKRVTRRLREHRRLLERERDIDEMQDAIDARREARAGSYRPTRARSPGQDGAAGSGGPEGGRRAS